MLRGRPNSWWTAVAGDYAVSRSLDQALATGHVLLHLVGHRRDERRGLPNGRRDVVRLQRCIMRLRGRLDLVPPNRLWLIGGTDEGLRAVGIVGQGPGRRQEYRDELVPPAGLGGKFTGVSVSQTPILPTATTPQPGR